MSYYDLVKDLLATPEGSSELDERLAETIGWQKVEHQAVENSETVTRTRTFWILPNSQEPGKVPPYTRSIQAAYELAEYIAPEQVCACSWADGKAKAQIGLEGLSVEAGSPAVALCIAVLRIHATRTR